MDNDFIMKLVFNFTQMRGKVDQELRTGVDISQNDTVYLKCLTGIINSAIDVLRYASLENAKMDNHDARNN